MGFGTSKRRAKHVGRGPLNSQRHLELVVNSLGRDQGSSINSSIKLSAQCSMHGNGQNTSFNLDIEDYLRTRNEIPKISCTWCGRSGWLSDMSRDRLANQDRLGLLGKGLLGSHNLPRAPSQCWGGRDESQSSFSV